MSPSNRWRRSTIRKTIHFIELENVPILEQLRLEEGLLRSDTRNFCLVNRGSPPAIVMGISGNPHLLVDLPLLEQRPIPLIKRFSGGGTVVVDEATLFVTFIMNREDLPEVEPFPEPILRWSASLYEKAWELPHFSLRENDYVLGDRKCGGNAQYLQKGRWLHHTSFLWDYREEAMRYLKLPPKRPAYRKDRPHTDFLTRLKEHTESPKGLIQKLKEALVKQLYIVEFDPKSWEEKPHRRATEEIKTLRREGPGTSSVNRVDSRGSVS